VGEVPQLWGYHLLSILAANTLEPAFTWINMGFAAGVFGCRLASSAALELSDLASFRYQMQWVN
jgi:hypothetical protein